MEQNITSIIAFAALILIVILIFRGLNRHFSRKRPMSEQEYQQAEVNKIASSETYSSGKKKKGGGYWVLFIIILILLFAWMWLGKGFHP